MTGNSVLKEITRKHCDNCKFETALDMEDCPNCKATPLTAIRIYKRFRTERIVFMVAASVVVSLVAFIVSFFVTGNPVPEFLLSGIFVLSLYAAGNFFLGIKFYDYFYEAEIPEEANQRFARSYFKSELRLFLMILIGVSIIATIFSLFGLNPGTRSR